MLKGVPKVLSPELLKILCEMGHGDEIVIGDANFLAESFGKRVVRADGIDGVTLLKAILKVIPVDTYSNGNLILMELLDCDKGKVNPVIWEKYQKAAEKLDKNVKVEHMERFAFYERAKNAFAIVASGESAIYANVIIKKGVIK